MTSRKFRLPVVLACLLAQGCVPESELLVTDKSFNPRLRPDLQALTAQQLADPTLALGAYRIASSEVASLASPIVALRGDDGLAANLVQSDCLWLAHDSATARGDRLVLRWEEVIGVAPGVDGEPPEYLPSHVGMCTGTDPATRALDVVTDGTTAAALAESGLEPGAQIFVTSTGGGLSVSDEPGAGDDIVAACSAQTVRSNGVDVTCQRVREARDVIVMRANGQATLPDTTGRCEPPSLAQLGTALAPNDHDLSVTLLDRTYAPSCSLDTTVAPPFDTFYGVRPGNRFFAPDANVPRTAALLGPRIKVVDRLRTITRTMRRRAGGTPNDLEWSVPVQQAPGAPPRWEENFLPSIAVTDVTLRARNETAGIDVPIGPDPMGTPANNPAKLCLENAVGACAYRCARDTGAPAAVLRFPIDLDHCVDANGNRAVPDASPSYNNALLDSAPGNLQGRPLTWRMDPPAGLPTAAGVFTYIVFNLRARLPGGAALTAERGAADFGAARVGNFANQSLRVRNEGDVALRVERVEVIEDNSATSRAGDFSVLLPGRETVVPLPVDFVPDGKAVRVGPGIGLDSLPLYRGQSSSHVLAILRERLRNASFRLYDQAFSVIDGLVVTANPAFDFQQAAERDFVRRNPTHAEYAAAGRALGFDASSLLQLPVDVAPGGSLRVHLTHAPTRSGHHSALLRVVARAALGNQSRTIHVVLRGDGMDGPQLELLPATLRFPVGSNGWHRGFAAINVGDQGGKVQSLSVEGRDAARFAVTPATQLPQLLGPGEALALQVDAAPRACNEPVRAAEAELVLDADGSRYAVPLAIAMESCR